MDNAQIHKEMEIIAQFMRSKAMRGRSNPRFMYAIRSGKVEVEGDLFLPTNYEHIPVPFRSVSKSFRCTARLTSLHNAPQEVGGNFSCTRSMITSLEGGPIEVGGAFDCSYTNITSLQGCPQYVGNNFWCEETKLASLEFAPREIGGRLFCMNVWTKAPDTSHIIISRGVKWE